MEIREIRVLSAGEAVGLGCCRVEQLWLYMGTWAVWVSLAYQGA